MLHMSGGPYYLLGKRSKTAKQVQLKLGKLHRWKSEPPGRKAHIRILYLTGKQTGVGRVKSNVAWSGKNAHSLAFKRIRPELKREQSLGVSY